VPPRHEEPRRYLDAESCTHRVVLGENAGLWDKDRRGLGELVVDNYWAIC